LRVEVEVAVVLEVVLEDEVILAEVVVEETNVTILLENKLLELILLVTIAVEDTVAVDGTKVLLDIDIMIADELVIDEATKDVELEN
jgi:hypothetical protein